jgi:hypothetical protein
MEFIAGIRSRCILPNNPIPKRKDPLKDYLLLEILEREIRGHKDKG